MQPLAKTLRSQLERAVKEARIEAEKGAHAALQQLGVNQSQAPAYLNEAQKELRRKLRAHGRQLGDSLNGGSLQTMDRLLEEVAYEHWHRMLFARFLAENNLLMYPDPVEPVAVSLEECEELAADEGAANGWELASRFAAQMLPQIFRPEAPVFQLELPLEHQKKLERLVAELPQQVFLASDSLGWVYQFWQAKRKDDINASEVKIGARELPAVTQLFTEPYMVSFLLDNSLGAWWAGQRLSEEDFKEAAGEEELRQKAALPGVDLEYLRFVQAEDGTWAPAAGCFEKWPQHLSELKTLDPCCGSGHFLVAAFLMLVPMRVEREGLSPRDAVDAVLRENLHGLELDQRCVELAAFALALAAWQYPGAGGYRKLPELHVACSGLSVSVAKEEWKQLGLGKKELTMALDWMHDTFQEAPTLGSLLDPTQVKAAKLTQWEELAQALGQALQQEPDAQRQETAVAAQGVAKAAALLTGRYQWVITNVPYLARGKQSQALRDFCEQHYPAAKNDLATVFLDRCLEFCKPGGTASIVLPQNWLFLTSYKKFREKLLENDTWHLIARLGPGAFETISGEVVKAILITLSRGTAAYASTGLLAGEQNLIHGVDVSAPRTAAEKAAGLLSAEMKAVEQRKQLENPSAIVSFSKLQNTLMLQDHCETLSGASSGDVTRFIRQYWEIAERSRAWEWNQTTVSVICHYGGMEQVVFLEEEKGEMFRLAQSVKHLNHAAQNWLRGKPFWGKRGVTISQMRSLPSCSYTGAVYDTNCCAVIPNNTDVFPAVFTFLQDSSFGVAVREVDQSLKVTPKNLLKITFDLAHWTEVAAEKYPHGLPQPYSDDPTQWIFHGHPCGAAVWDEEIKRLAIPAALRTDDTVLQVAVARLLGYRWPAELDATMELAEEQREWVNRCEALLPLADKDGIVCIPPVRGEASAADRLLNLLAAAYGETWSNEILTELLKNADHAGKTLETWLREKFFAQHCKQFQHRPFIWHIWDGLRDGFAALVNYHKLDRKNLETLIYTYLGDWITRQKQDIAAGIDGGQERLDAAEALKKKLELILEGQAPYDIFVRWKPLAEQPLGWEPDLNDGVRLNIRPFLSVPDVGKKGAGVLRDKPNVKWDKDRGKDVASAPWYHVFNGDRINDHHLTLEEKREAREGK